MTIVNSDNIFTQLDYKKKIRNLKLEQEALMLEIADTLFLPFV